jgi:predicted RecA/RadA family phage recombinase
MERMNEFSLATLIRKGNVPVLCLIILVLLFGCRNPLVETIKKDIASLSAKPEIIIKQGTDDLPDNTGEYFFAGTNVGSHTDAVFTIENPGTADLLLTGTPSIEFSGTDASMFTVFSPPDATIAPGNSTDFTLRFTPGSIGTKTASLSIYNNDADENPYNFALTGTANAADMRVRQGYTNIADDTGSYTFADQYIGSYIDITFTIWNFGTLNLELTGGTKVEIGGADAGMFTVTNQPSTPIAPSYSTTFSVRFEPTSAGAKSATVSISNNDPEGNPYNFALYGTGIVPPPEMNVKQGTTNIADGTGSYNFSSTQVGSHLDVVFTIENLGIGDLNLTGNPKVTVGGGDAGMYAVISDPSSPIAPSSSTTFTIRFEPPSPGAKSATVSISNNDSSENPYNFAISGSAYLGDVRITNASSDSSLPSLVWSGSEYGVAWQDSRDGNNEIYYARISASGQKQGSDVRITNDLALSRYPSLVWTTGSKYGVAWDDTRDGNYEIYFARIDGVKQGNDVRITNALNSSLMPSLCWRDPFDYAVMWMDDRDGNNEIYFARISSGGALINLSEARVTINSAFKGVTRAVWTGSEYGVAWHDSRNGDSEIYFARVNTIGTKQGSDVRITNASDASLSPSLVWTGSAYGVAWCDDRDGNREIYFARISSAGVKQGSDIRITNAVDYSLEPSLVWTGSEYGVAWGDDRDGNREIYFARISAGGVKQGSDVRITNASGVSSAPSLVWAGSEYGVAWYDTRDGNSEIYFACISSSGVKK